MPFFMVMHTIREISLVFFCKRVWSVLIWSPSFVPAPNFTRNDVNGWCMVVSRLANWMLILDFTRLRSSSPLSFFHSRVNHTLWYWISHIFIYLSMYIYAYIYIYLYIIYVYLWLSMHIYIYISMRLAQQISASPGTCLVLSARRNTGAS